MVDRYLVVGNPIGHSRSPAIHAMFARATGQDIDYQAQLIEPGHFSKDVDAFFADGGKGMNVTLPFKQEAFDYAAALSDEARLAGAVNTLALGNDGRVTGYNTDGIGLVADLQVNAGWVIKGRSILVLGAGGAVRGVLAPLLAQQPSRVVIANRTENKARELADAFSGTVSIEAAGFADVGGAFDLVINGTSASLAGDLPPLDPAIVAAGACVYDMAYGARPTVFMDWASANGAAQCRDGLGMLVEQAAESFRIWRGVKPPTDGVIETLRRDVNAG